MSSKTIKNKELKDLEDFIKGREVIDAIVARDFNESFSSENITKFMNETGSCDVFVETNGVEIENREETH